MYVPPLTPCQCHALVTGIRCWCNLNFTSHVPHCEFHFARASRLSLSATAASEAGASADGSGGSEDNMSIAEDDEVDDEELVYSRQFKK